MRGSRTAPAWTTRSPRRFFKTRRFFKKRAVSGNRTGLHPDTVRFQLERLEEDGLVSRRIRRSGEPGRPPLTYTATPVPDAEHGHREFAQLAQLVARTNTAPGGRSHRRRPILGPRPDRVPSRANPSSRCGRRAGRDTGRDRIRLRDVRRRRTHQDPTARPPNARSGQIERSQRIGLRGHLG